jgi:parallel beta-helix repeat protein
MKKIVLLAFVLVVSSVAMLVRFTRPVEASGTIYIRADGSIEGTTFIQTADNITYIFVANINDSIVVERNNTVVDGNGYTLQGTGNGTGIDLCERENVTVRNTQIKKFSYGIWLRYSNNNSISGNNVTENNRYGIYIYPSSNCNSIVGNNITENNNGGINLWGSSGNNIVGNDITNSYYGIDLQYSSGNIISGNNITNNNYDGISLSYSSGNIISGNNIAANNQGIDLFHSSSSIISGNNITNNDDGIHIWYSSKNSMAGNTITANSGVGISLSESSNNNSISGNNLRNNYGGIGLGSSSNNTLTRNNITNNSYYGFSLSYSSGNIISGNNITNNKLYGIQLLYSSNNNSIYHNNFINNLEQVYSSKLTNTWDDGYPSGGNYWSDYLTRYPNATEIDHTGIGDISYEINANNTDHYPLMIPYETTPPTITIIILSPENKTYAVNAGIPLTFTVDGMTTWIGYSLNGQANVTITGNVTLPTLTDGWHHVTIYANGTFDNMGFATVYFTVDTTKPDITNLVQDPPTNILPDTVVKINATVIDATSGIKQVLLNCTFTNSTDTWYTVFSMAHLRGDIWNATIRPYPYGTNVTYVIIAEDSAGNTITTEQLGYEYEYQIVPEFPTWTSMLLILIVLTLAIAIYKRRLPETPIH